MTEHEMVTVARRLAAVLAGRVEQGGGRAWAGVVELVVERLGAQPTSRQALVDAVGAPDDESCLLRLGDVLREAQRVDPGFGERVLFLWRDARWELREHSVLPGTSVGRP